MDRTIDFLKTLPWHGICVFVFVHVCARACANFKQAITYQRDTFGKDDLCGIDFIHGVSVDLVNMIADPDLPWRELPIDFY